MQQGRVQLDSDWNEWLAELSRRTQAGTLDIAGRAAYPATTPWAFLITASSAGGNNSVSIGPGRMYVDGLLAENHGDPAAAVWDPALAELSNSPQPPPASETGAIDYFQQPFLPNPPPIEGNGPFLAYLDVWTRPVTHIEDADLVDKAVGVDTTGRLQTVWQVKLMPVQPGATCGSPVEWPASSAGLLTTGPVASKPSGPCCLSSETGYTGQENQFYRVEIHRSGSAATSPMRSRLPAGTATFKWSRENASVITAVTAISAGANSQGGPASVLTVVSLGRDQVLGFAPGAWIEVIDDSLELAGKPGELHQIDAIDFAARTITLVSPVSGTFNITDTSHTRIRRWDQSGKVYLSDGTTVWWDLDAAGGGDIPVPPAGTLLILENGITVSFDLREAAGSFITGDFWTFAARTADGSIDKLAKAPPRGIHHHRTPLAIVSFSPLGNTDCRTPWPPLQPGTGDCGCCCTVTVGDGIDSKGQFTSIQAAIQSLPAAGGEVCILPGRYFERVFIENRRDVVIRGCGWQTRLASPSEQPPVILARPASAAAASAFTAVITIAASQHIRLESFVVEADAGDVGVLIDGTGRLAAPPSQPAPPEPAPRVRERSAASRTPTLDISVEDLVITGSNRPAILAAAVRLLEIGKNRIAMANVRSTWPAVWVSGLEIRISHNWVGAQGTRSGLEWIPAIVAADLGAQTAAASAAFTNPGGIQIAGPSQDVLVVENEIEDSGRNGITLGSLSVVDAKGNDTGIIIGVIIVEQDPCPGTVTIVTGGGAPGGGTVIAGDKLTNIQIHRNRIRNIGLCGIGPVGFFDLRTALEVISIENLSIGSNQITNAMQVTVAAIATSSSAFGYGAICLPDVENLTIRDNTITDYGSTPGQRICGIFILHAEKADISRNQVVETRDWTAPGKAPSGGTGFRAGICGMLISPPAFSTASTLTTASTIYEPGLPALRIEHNVVRVPLAQALTVEGFGTFSIVNNHFACGGTLVGSGDTEVAQTVLIMNLGTAIETAGRAASFSSLYNSGAAAFQTSAQQITQANGGIVFTNNVCQLEARALGGHAYSNVLIFTRDSLIFSNNQCWVDGPRLTAALDAWLLAVSLQATSNRFQEGPGFPVLASGLTVGAMNITTQNISTYCLFVEGTAVVNVNNVSVVPASTCTGNLKG
jgi:hypothetical protein